MGPARAEFRFWQDRAPYDTPVPMYNILGDHPQFGSTVGATTLESLKIEIPPTPKFDEWKAGRSKTSESGASYGMAPIIEFYHRAIKPLARGAKIALQSFRVGGLRPGIENLLGISEGPFVSSRVLKHIHEQRPRVADFIVEHMDELLDTVDIFRNYPDKLQDRFLLAKRMGRNFVTVLEVANQNGRGKVVSIYTASDEAIKKLEPLRIRFTGSGTTALGKETPFRPSGSAEAESIPPSGGPMSASGFSVLQNQDPMLPPKPGEVKKQGDLDPTLFKTRAGYSGEGKLGTSGLGTRPAAGGVAPSGDPSLDTAILPPSSGQVKEKATAHLRHSGLRLPTGGGAPSGDRVVTKADFVKEKQGQEGVSETQMGLFGGSEPVTAVTKKPKPVPEERVALEQPLFDKRGEYGQDLALSNQLKPFQKTVLGVRLSYGEELPLVLEEIYGKNVTPEELTKNELRTIGARSNRDAFLDGARNRGLEGGRQEDKSLYRRTNAEGKTTEVNPPGIPPGSEPPVNPNAVSEHQMGLFGGAELGRAVTKKPKPVPEGQGTLFGGRAQPKFEVPKSAFTPEQIAQQPPPVQQLLATPEGKHQVPQDPLPRAIRESVVIITGTRWTLMLSARPIIEIFRMN